MNFSVHRSSRVPQPAARATNNPPIGATKFGFRSRSGVDCRSASLSVMGNGSSRPDAPWALHYQACRLVCDVGVTRTQLRPRRTTSLECRRGHFECCEFRGDQSAAAVLSRVRAAAPAAVHVRRADAPPRTSMPARRPGLECDGPHGFGPPRPHAACNRSSSSGPRVRSPAPNSLTADLIADGAGRVPMRD